MAEMNIELEGRILVKTDVKEIAPGKIVSKSIYNDGTEISFIQTAENIG